MKPSADAPAVDKAVDSEVDTYLDTDSDPPASGAGAEAPRPGAESRAPRGSVRVPTQPDRSSAEPVMPDVRPAEPEQMDQPAAEPVLPIGPALTDREREILAFEQQWWRHAGAKEQAIRDAFGLSATRYYQLLNGLLDKPAALAVDPILVGRLRRLRSARARTRRR